MSDVSSLQSSLDKKNIELRALRESQEKVRTELGELVQVESIVAVRQAKMNTVMQREAVSKEQYVLEQAIASLKGRKDKDDSMMLTERSLQESLLKLSKIHSNKNEHRSHREN